MEWVVIPFSRGSSGSRDQTQTLAMAGRFFTVWATKEAPYPYKPSNKLNTLKQVLNEYNHNYCVLLDCLRRRQWHPTQYSCLANPMDGGAWWAAVHGVAKSQTWLSDFTFTFHFHALEKEMATHSSVLAWRIPGTGECDGLLSMGLQRVGHDWSNLAAAAADCLKSEIRDEWEKSGKQLRKIF